MTREPPPPPAAQGSPKNAVACPSSPSPTLCIVVKVVPKVFPTHTHTRSALECTPPKLGNSRSLCLIHDLLTLNSLGDLAPSCDSDRHSVVDREVNTASRYAPIKTVLFSYHYKLTATRDASIITPTRL